MRAYFGTVHALVIYIYASLELALHHPSIHLCWFHLKERCCAHVRSRAHRYVIRPRSRVFVCVCAWDPYSTVGVCTRVVPRADGSDLR